MVFWARAWALHGHDGRQRRGRTAAAVMHGVHRHRGAGASAWPASATPPGRFFSCSNICTRRGGHGRFRDQGRKRRQRVTHIARSAVSAVLAKLAVVESVGHIRSTRHWAAVVAKRVAVQTDDAGNVLAVQTKYAGIVSHVAGVHAHLVTVRLSRRAIDIRRWQRRWQWWPWRMGWYGA